MKLFALLAAFLAVSLLGVPAHAAAAHSHPVKPAAFKATIAHAGKAVKAAVIPAASACCTNGNCCADGDCCTMPGCCQAGGACCDAKSGACTSACGCLTMPCCSK